MTSRHTLLLILALSASSSKSSASHPFELSETDRVVFVGSALVEREQSQGYLETALASRNPGRGIVFRNLGWSGDTVFGEARAAFDPPAVGYKRLVEQVLAAKPTVLFVGYGGVESFNGPAGLARFVAGMNTLLNDLAPLHARLVLLGPTKQEDLGRPLPDPRHHNQEILAYRDAIQTIAQQRDAWFVDLFEDADGPLSTQDGILPDDLGYWQLSQRIERGLNLPQLALAMELDSRGRGLTSRDLLSENPEIGPGFFRFQLRSLRLPLPPPPTSHQALPGSNPLKLTIHGLQAGRYAVFQDGRDSGLRASAEEFDRGLLLQNQPDVAQVDRLRTAIVNKNRLEFYRYRPQNETYLFGFRKHEQGRNAAEVVLFDPLVAAQEQTIVQLTKPTSHLYELRAETGDQSR